MYYYYYYYYPETIEINIEFEFEVANGELLSFDDITLFFNSLSELHKRIIFVTQSEYSNANGNFSYFHQASLLSYNQLELKSISSSENGKFILKLVFRLVKDNINIYWLIWRILIDICKRYGKNSKNLDQTIHKAISFYEGLEVGLVLDSEKIKKIIQNLLINSDFKKHYDSFCLNSIKITDIISRYNFYDSISEKMMEPLELQLIKDSKGCE